MTNRIANIVLVKKNYQRQYGIALTDREAETLARFIHNR